MKIITLSFVCLLLVFISCRNSGDKNATESNTTPEKEVDISPISSIIQGIWLPRVYVQDIHESRSAFTAYRSIPEIAEMQIDPDLTMNDTLYVESSLNNHEGYRFRIWFTEQNGQISINSDVKDWDSEEFNYELTFQIERDTILQLLTKDKAGNIKNTAEYLRIRDKKSISNYGGLGYEYLARKVLLNGTYQVLDSTKSSLGEVSFDAASGSIKGFKLNYYTFLTDFGGGPSFEGDHIILRPEEEDYKNTEVYVLQNVSDTLIFYSTEEKISDDDYEILLKSKIYYLIKK